MADKIVRCLRGFAFVGFLFLMCLPKIGWAVHLPTQKTVLDNGLTVLITPMPESPFVTLVAVIKTGAATEGTLLGSGASHFLEHMIFKGTHDRGVGEIAARVQALGGQINASTGKDQTSYFIKVPRDHFSEALSIISDMVMNARIDQDEFEREREVILNEMRMNNDNPDRRVYVLANQVIYHRHPYQHPTIGYPELFKSITRDDLFLYYKQRYVPNNMIFSVAGGFEGDVLPQIQAVFQDFQRGFVQPRNLPPESVQFSPRTEKFSYPTDLARLSMSFPTISLLDEDLFALDVLAQLLGDGKSSRLYEQLFHQKELVHRISAYSYTPVDQGFFMINAVLESDKCAAVQESVWQIIEEIQQNGVQASELKKARAQVLREHVFSLQTSDQLAHSRGFNEAFTGDWNFSDVYIKGINKVTADEVRRVAKKYLIAEKLSVVILGPDVVKQEVSQEQDPVAQKGNVTRTTLNNGIPVLIKEDATLPMVHMRLLFNGGLRFENEQDNGIFKLMASVWNKESRRYPYEKLQALLDEHAISLSSYAGKNSFGLDINGLAQDWDLMLAVVDDISKNPLFHQDQLDKARQQQLVAIRLREDSIISTALHKMRQQLYGPHPYGFDPNGSEATLAGLTPQQLKQLHRQWAVADNMVITVFGDIRPEEVLAALNKKFGHLKKGFRLPENAAMEPLSAAQELELDFDKEQAAIVLGFRGVTIDHTDRYGLEVLTAVLGSPFSGRLFQIVREQYGQAYTLGGQSTPGMDPGSIFFYVQTQADELDHIKRILEEQINLLQTELVSDEELSTVRQYLKGSEMRQRETLGSLSMICGLDELYGVGFDDYKLHDDRIDAVTPEDIQRLAKQYLNLDKKVMVVLRPQEDGIDRKTLHKTP